jgi:hypothetical protein
MAKLKLTAIEDGSRHCAGAAQGRGFPFHKGA